MFGSRSGSPYPGATGLLNSGNASAGQGGPLSTAGNVPPPSGGMPQSSVYNRTLDNEPNVVPSQFMFPSSHPALKGDNNKIREGDLLFVLRDMNACFANDVNGAYGDSYRTRQARLSKDEVPLVTIQKLNELLRNAAQQSMGLPNAQADVNIGAVNLQTPNAVNLLEFTPPAAPARRQVDQLLVLNASNWWQNPELVAQWAVPLGAALNSVQLNRYGGGGEPNNRANREDWQAHNVVVSRKANVKNNFYSIKAHKGEKWHSQSMQRVGVQYSVEQVRVAADAELVYCVQCTCLLLDDPLHIKGETLCSRYNNLFPNNLRSRRVVPATANVVGRIVVPDPPLPPADAARPNVLEAIVYDHTKPTGTKVEPNGYHLFEEKPMGDPAARVIVQIGRVLHSAPRQPGAYQCLTSCFNKNTYDGLKPIEIELGCP